MQLALDNATISYEIVGPPTAPVVALAHNFAGDRRVWDAQLEALASYRVLRWDARGHGQSTTPPPPYSFATLADDLIAILDVNDIARCHFCGVSMGGMVGQHVALRHPERVASLMLINTTSRYDDAQRGAWRERIDRVRTSGVLSMHDELMARWFTPASLEKRLPGVAVMSECYRAFSAEAFCSYAAMIGEIDTTASLNRIACPTLILAGAEDPATPPAMSEFMHACIADSRYYVVAGAAHLSQIEQPEKFNQRVTDFLRSVAT